MKLPNHERAVVAREKLSDYLLNVAHKRGGTKAKLLAQFGYTASNWRQLEADLRAHLDEEADTVRMTAYGARYEIRMALQTPTGESLTLRTIWQVDDGTDHPRLITLYPD